MSGVVLASASPIRAELLKRAGIGFEIEAAAIDEAAIRDGLKAEGASAEEAADALAEAKAMRVGRRRPDDLVIGADQILDLDGAWLEKPGTEARARAQLARLGGRSHRLVSAAVAVLGGRRIWGATEAATLAMRPLDAAAIEAHLTQAGPGILASVGSYQIEGVGIRLFERIDGDYFTILGLPLLPLLGFLRTRGHGK
ncbi:MAG: septum formation protein Maf [Alphaproteobacteria bacterium]|nr:septum formation protein Maf [Alphaproteobacteria bacterium]